MTHPGSRSFKVAEVELKADSSGAQASASLRSHGEQRALPMLCWETMAAFVAPLLWDARVPPLRDLTRRCPQSLSEASKRARRSVISPTPPRG